MVNCASCGKREEELGRGLTMMRCARCFHVSYCDSDCQKTHWAAHRAFCKERAAVLAENAKSVAPVGMPVDINIAALRRAADGGNAIAMSDLGMCYQFGKGGLQEDTAEAARWYTRATETPNPPAEVYCNLANCYYRGDGVLKNMPEAVRLYRIAAEMGHTGSQYQLGTCLQHGEGVPYNPVEAFKWFKRASDAGDAAAQCMVGCALDNGLGVPEDKAAGVMYYRRAADQGDATAMYNLGAYYQNGDGVLRDMPQAVAWLTRARDAGRVEAVTALAKVAPLLTPAQRAEVDQLLATPLPRMPAPTAPAAMSAGAPLPTLADVLAMGTGALKRLLQGRGVDTSGVLEKSELVGLALAAIGAAPQ